NSGDARTRYALSVGRTAALRRAGVSRPDADPAARSCTGGGHQRDRVVAVRHRCTGWRDQSRLETPRDEIRTPRAPESVVTRRNRCRTLVRDAAIGSLGDDAACERERATAN